VIESEANLKRPQFLNVKELADMLRTKPRTIYDWVSQRKIPFRKADERIFFDRERISRPAARRNRLSNSTTGISGTTLYRIG
jgi:excisionase family DNA binding protein